MISFLNWNARGLGSSVKRRFLSDIFFTKRIDIVGIQETKKDSFPVRMLNAFSSTISRWIFKSSQGSSGGILVSINETKFELLNSWIMDFSISLHLRNKNEDFEWLFTVVYGPVISSQRSLFLAELRAISLFGIQSWLFCGDFNLIRTR